MKRRVLLAFALALLVAGPVLAQRELTKIPDPDPELERKSFKVADGFEVNLFAADPMLAKPIQMNFDPQGRLWVASSEVYPQIQPGQKANDRVLVLEDRDGDGKADKTSVFAEGLLIPTGLEPGDGGVYVADSTELLHLADTDGDGKADRRRVMLSGFGTEDTHHILHTFRWGHDGLLYFNQSIYIHSHIETPHGVRRLRAGGVWQFRPETMRLEVFVRGFVNAWGHHIDRWGQSFGTDGAYGEGVNYLLPGASYVAVQPPGGPRLMTGLNPGSPKHCGFEIVSGRHLPDDWQGNVITNDFRGHRVCRFVLSEDGAGYASREKPELIKTDHAAFRPIDVKMGPDGAIYIADWYNPIIQHGEVDFRDPRRDHTHGRIWRITAKGRSPVQRPELVGAKTGALLEALKAPEDWTRHQAKRVLKERGADKVRSALAAWVKALDPADANAEHHLLEALWVYQGLDVVEAELLSKLLRASDPRARAAATRVIAHWHDRLANPAELLAARVADEHPRVRLEAVRSLAELKTARAAEVAMTALDRPMDRFLDYALWLTARDLEPYWMPEFQAGRLDFGANAQQLLFALQATGSRDAVGPLVRLVQGGKVPADREDGVLGLIATLGGPTELSLVLQRTLAAKDSRRQTSSLMALVEAARQRGVRPAGDLRGVEKLLASESEAVRAAAARAVGLWKMESLRLQLADLARADATPAGLRDAAIDALASLADAESRGVLESLADGTRPVPVRRAAIVALASVDLKAAATRAVELLGANPPAEEATAICTVFLERKGGDAALSTALAGKKLPADAAKIGIRTVRTTGRNVPALVDALTKAGGVTIGPKVLGPDEMKKTVTEVLEQGNAARGEQVYNRKDMACLKCHAIAGAGGQVGPDLSSIGASAPVDYLIDSLLQPNKAVKEGYHSLTIATTDGKITTGVKVRETKDELVLRTAEDREAVVALKKIEEKTNAPSIMPDSLMDPLTRQELLDLVRFLSELGKVGPYSVGQARVVRRWQALDLTRESYTLISRNSDAAVARADAGVTWSPVYSRVGGVLQLQDLPRFERKKVFADGTRFTTFVRCQLDVSTAGKAKLRFNSPAGLTLWVDGDPVDVKDETVLDLVAGVRTLTLAIDREARQDGLRLELDDMPGSPARVRVVGGK